MSKPTLSVIMPNYNYSKYIGEALDALFAQTYSPMEVIICDDGSTDSSVEIINEYIKRYPGIKFMRNEKNMGGLYTVNKCLEIATGDYVYYIASDDKILPGFFEKAMNLLIKYPKAGLCFGDYAILEGKRRIENKLYLADKPSYFSPVEFFKLLQRTEFTVIAGISVVVKRAALIEAGGFLPEIKWSSDIFAHHVIGFRYGVCYLPEITGLMRKHDIQYTAKHKRPLALELEVIKDTMDIVLRPQYSDVRDKFMKTAPFAHCTWDILKLAIFNKKYRGFFSFKLLRYAFFDKFVRRGLLRILPLNTWRVILNNYKRVKLVVNKLIRGRNALNG